tara:strand:- start:565 stop:900 length:336 start_codon:yes stop_codon:yes gene_type:complete
MGLSKTIELNTGVVVEYHRIEDVSFSPTGNMQVRIMSYIDEATRVAGKEPAWRTRLAVPLKERKEIKSSIEGEEPTVEIIDLEADIPDGNFISRAYEMLKRQPAWSDAEDA